MTLQPFRVMNGVPPEETAACLEQATTVARNWRKKHSRKSLRKGAEMETYIKTMENRKELVKRLEQLTGERAVYTRMPECAFIIGYFKVERYGTLVITEEEQDGDAQEIINTLLEEGAIMPVPDEEPAEAEEETEEGSTDDQENEDSEPETISISLPLEGHTAGSIRNLAAMLVSRGNLISKATGGQFSCTAEMMEAINTATDIPTIKRILDENSDTLEGLVIEEDRIMFAGFPLTDDPKKTNAFMQLASLMNRMALEQKHTLARPVAAENEKYSFRIWLISLGMKGDEYAQTRKILLAPLSGNAAFKDEAMQNRWKEKQKAKRAAAQDGPTEDGLSSERESEDTEETAEPFESTVTDESVPA